MSSSIIESGSKEKKFQKKRKHYRWNCLWDIEYQVISDTDKNENKEELWLKGITTDISGGGCRFNSEEQQKQGDILIIKIKGLEKEKEVELFFHARVIASLPLSNRKKTYENRVEFLEIPFLEQEKLIQWIFEEKRKRKWQERSLDDEKKYFDY